MIGSLVFSNPLLRWRIGRAVAYSFSNLILLFLICVAIRAATIREQWLHLPPELLVMSEHFSIASEEPTSSITEVYAFRAQCLAMCICMGMIMLSAMGSLYRLWHYRLRARDASLGVLPVSRPQYIAALYDAPLMLRTAALMAILATLLLPDRGLPVQVPNLLPGSPIDFVSLEVIAGAFFLVALGVVLYVYRAIQLAILTPSLRLLLRILAYPGVCAFIVLLMGFAFNSDMLWLWGMGYVLPVMAIIASLLALHPQCPFWRRDW